VDTGRTDEVPGIERSQTLGGHDEISRHLMHAEAMARFVNSIFYGAARLGRSAAAPLARWWGWRATYQALRDYSDRLLAGMGIARADIPLIAREIEPREGDAGRGDIEGGDRAGAPLGPSAPPPSAPPPPHIILNLALQGGGAHGAFTWGALDRLLEDERIAFEGVSGASAGAVNAVLLASGWLADGRAGARRALDAFWGRLTALAATGSFSPALGLLTKNLSPYQFNPLDLNPLRALLAELVDFGAIRRADEPRLFVAATRVRTGACRIFRNRELSVEAVLASACLPQLHRAVEIDGEAYWDGGFSSNPPLLPLAEHCRARDLLLIQLSPSEVAELPVTAPDIRGRMSQIVFNAPLLHELRALELGARRTGVRLHRIDATAAVAPLGAESAGRPDRDLLLHLREEGRAAAAGWLGTLARSAAAPVKAA
jgi:NTE family protein